MTGSNCLRDILSKNRAEELGYDVWEDFVIPPFFDRLDLRTARKPRVILGGRGCGKTMLLRYLSHQSAFSPKRKAIPDEAVSHIGLYWRTDTQFSNAMLGRGVEEDSWAAAFNHYAALILGIEIVRSLAAIAHSQYETMDAAMLEQVSLERLSVFDKSLPSSLASLAECLEDRVWQFETWVNDVRKNEEPNFLPGNSFIKALIKLAEAQLPCLKDAVFFVYVDEYENLCEYQQRIINTWLKHSEPPLIYNLAMKRHSFKTTETTGPESLNDIHDYRQHDLEQFSSDTEFQAFAAEILFLNLSKANLSPVGLDTDLMRDPTRLSQRREAEYCKSLIDHAKAVFPGLTHQELADYVFSQPSLVNRLKANILSALKEKGSDISTDAFIRASSSMAAIITPALLHRSSIQPDAVLHELDALAAGEDNKFTGTTGWIHNNFIASVIQLFAPYAKTCPFYSGFDAFCRMSRGNIRHFLELCHQSLARIADCSYDGTLSVDPLEQAEASKQASATLLGEVRGFGRLGPQLLTFTYRLGNLFSLAHARKTLSENEQTHFCITRGSSQFTADDHDFMKEALKWSILFESESTKDKSKYLNHGVEYTLNPIYAPYFNISYRKMRRLELASSDIECLIRGNIDQFKNLIATFSQKWGMDVLNEADLPLFQVLADEDEDEA